VIKKINDPFYQREIAKYGSAIPSREYVLQILEDFGRPMSKKQLFKALGLGSDDEQETMQFRLKAMLRDGQIMLDRRNRFCLMQRINLKRGKVQAHPEGYGFFISDADEPDMVLSAKEMRGVMHGDIVYAWQQGFDRRGRPEGKIHEVVEHANHTVVGRFFKEHGVGFVVPDSKRITQDISVPLEYAGDAKEGQMVLVEILAFPSKRNQAVGKVIHILGEHMAPGMEIDVAIYAHGIPAEWPDPVLEEVAAINQHVNKEDIAGRKDLRELAFVTIDGEDAKDFDDAVFCQKHDNGDFLLRVAIADVSHYVKAGSSLDMEAANRGNSVYFPGRVVPMLPEALSNGICSLNPHVDRLCMVAELSISANGAISRSRFYRAVFQSNARLTYTEVAKALSSKQPSAQMNDAVWKNVTLLYELYQLLSTHRKNRGAIDFDTTETKIVFDANRKIERIVPVERNEAHKLIEECMLAANVAVGGHLQKSKIASLYRVHEVPDEEKINQLREFLAGWGLSLGGGQKPHAKDYLKTMADIGVREERHIIETVMLRSLKQARYSEKNEGHFGLAYPVYTHFTSPIRRYPDLLIHRALGHMIDRGEAGEFCYSNDEMSKYAKHCSETERRADDATREVISWLKCEFMQDKLGQVFTGTVSSVTSFGIFVELKDIYVEGLIHVTSLHNDYYSFDSRNHQLVGQRSGQTYQLGDKLEVLVARVNLDERKIDFELASELIYD
jgi:ribonuclease R